MSGGYMDYAYHRLEDIAEYVDDREIKDLLNDLATLIHDLEWWKSGDYSASDYQESLKEFKSKWFSENRDERLKEYISQSLDKLKEEIEILI